MILKFKTNGGAEENYQFIDGVSDLIVNKGPRVDFNNNIPLRDGGIDCWWEDESVRTNESVYMNLIWVDKRGIRQSYVTHLPTFLLNDSGKTIERLI